MSLSKKPIYILLSGMLLALSLAACGNTEDPATGSDQPKSKKTKKDQGSDDLVKQGAANIQGTTSQLQDALQQQDTDKVKKLGGKINDQWLSFENEVRDRFPLFYTKVEKYEQPIFAQSTMDQPDLARLKKQAEGLQNALDELENAKETAQKTSEVLNKAVKNYHQYIIEQTSHLVDATKDFTSAVQSGNMEKAKSLYPDARVYYERIEPIAESLGDLDPKIDARSNDVEDSSNWSGFHRLEKALWKDKSLEGQKKYADQLLKDVQQLQTKVKSIDLKPEQVVAGSMELLNEAAISKITGEEERYSHVDLVDLAANIDGSEAVYHAVIPALEENNKDLTNKLDQQFQTFHQTLQKYQKNGSYVKYDTLSKDQIRELSDQLTQLSKLMAQTAKIFS